jgi:hypothetical protein
VEDVRAWADRRLQQVKPAGPTEIHALCPFCDEEPGKRGRLYINTDMSVDPPGQYECKLCGDRGAWNRLRKYFGDPIIRDEDKDEWKRSTPVGRNVHRFAADFYYQNLADNPQVLTYLKESRGLTFDTIEAHKIGYAPTGNKLRKYLEGKEFTEDEMMESGLVNHYGYDFLKDQITIPYVVNGNVVQIRGKEIGGKYLTPPRQKSYPYNIDSVRDGADELVICEGEFDALVAEQMGYASIGVPGAMGWQDDWTDMLSDVKRKYICFDLDETGRKAADKLSDKLPAAKIITLPTPPEHMDDEEEVGLDLSDMVNDYGLTPESFKSLLLDSKGGLLISVREAYERWLEVEGNPDLAGLKFGITKLDEAIKPGLLPGQVMVTLAKTGAGKTISMLNFFHRMKREQPDRNFLFVSLEQTSNEWFERARRIHRFYEPSSRVGDTISFWQDNFMMIDKNRVTEEELCACIEQYEMERGKLDLVAIDYLGYFANSFKGDKYSQVSAAIMACKAVGKEYKLPVYTPVQVSRDNEAGEEPELSGARDSGVIEESADFAFALWAMDQRKGTEVGERTGEVGLKILKSRHGGVGTKVNMLFTPKTLAMIPENDMLHYKAADEIRLCRMGDDLDTVVYRNITGWDGTIMTAEVQAHMDKLRAEGIM